MKQQKLCCNCEYGGPLFKLGGKGIPHCHCRHPDIKEFGWDSLREAFEKCDKFEMRNSKEENETVRAGS